MKLWRLLTTSALMLLISGCSTFQEWFGSEGEDATAPVQLERIDSKVSLKKRWSSKIGDGQGDGFYKITPTLIDGVIYVASSDGEVAAINAIMVGSMAAFCSGVGHIWRRADWEG